jgi:hypothetical protein
MEKLRQQLDELLNRLHNADQIREKLRDLISMFTVSICPISQHRVIIIGA